MGALRAGALGYVRRDETVKTDENRAQATVQALRCGLVSLEELDSL